MEFFHEVFDSLIQRLESDVNDLDRNELDLDDEDVQEGLISMACIVYTMFGIYANLPFHHNQARIFKNFPKLKN